jgi:ribonuclease Z
MIDVLLLGNGAMLPLPKRWLSSALVRINGSLMLLDCGEGTQITWRRFHWGFKRLDAICLSHHHADHVAGLPGLFHTISNAGRTEPMHIYGPPGTIEVIKGLRVIAPWLGFDMVIHELEGGEVFELPSGLQGRVAWGDHRIPVLAYRFDMPRSPGFLADKAEALGIPRPMWKQLQRGQSVEIAGRVIEPDEVLTGAREGISLGFATDTRPTEGIRELMTDADLLISEATYGDDAEAEKAVVHKHMTFREAATLAKDANVGGLWLTHFGVGMNDPSRWDRNARDVFPGVELGYAGLTGRIAFDEGYVSTGPARSGSDYSPESDDSMNAEIAAGSPI